MELRIPPLVASREASDSLHWESTYLASLRRQNRKADSRADAERTAFLPSGKGAPLAAVAHDDSVLYFDVQLEGKTAAYRVACRPTKRSICTWWRSCLSGGRPPRDGAGQHEAATLDREWPWEDVLQEGTPSDATFADCITFEGRPPQIDILVEGEQHHRVTSGGTSEVVLYSPKHDAWMYNRKMARVPIAKVVAYRGPLIRTLSPEDVGVRAYLDARDRDKYHSSRARCGRAARLAEQHARSGRRCAAASEPADSSLREPPLSHGSRAAAGAAP